MIAPADRPDRPHSPHGLVLQPFRAVRPRRNGTDLAAVLCPPYDVIGPAERTALLARDPANAVSVVLPETNDGTDPYQHAADVLEQWVEDGVYAVDADPALYVYEMRDATGATTRGLLGAVALRDPEDGVILPHENTMAGPVADRLALMAATQTDVEPIYLVYDGGGPASDAVRAADDDTPLAEATTDDGITHRLWAIRDAATHKDVADDLRRRRALIADGHHRYATYRELQERMRRQSGSGPWDYGLTLLVDSTSYGPQVHAIHRVLRTLGYDEARSALADWDVTECAADSPQDAIEQLSHQPGFAVALTDGSRTTVVVDRSGRIRAAAEREGETATLTDLDVTVLHRGLVETVWQLADSVETVGYAHSVDEAIDAAAADGGVAVLLRPTPVAAVAAVAASGARMPRKSTLFTPKPASGLVMRRFADA